MVPRILKSTRLRPLEDTLVAGTVRKTARLIIHEYSPSSSGSQSSGWYTGHGC